MAVFKCKMCGGSLDIADGISVATCEYCGAKQTVPQSRDDVVANLFNRANNLRLKCEFDKAEQIYEKILDIDNTDAEAHWGIVLCQYGIEYVEDPKTYARIPTCHRTLYEAVLTSADYVAAIENADAEQKALYMAEARSIDDLQKNILRIVDGEEPFDVFICYKETDENGKRTVDSTIANDIYYQLVREGFKVFYAPITLEDKLGYEYEPYIFAALNSAKVMLVVGTKPEYFDSVWVRNEWSRFLKLTKSERKKILVPCYRDMDAYELPEEFAHLQAQDMGKIGFINDVIRGIHRVVKTEEPLPATTPSADVPEREAFNTSAAMDKVQFLLEDKKWGAAKRLCNKVIAQDFKCADAYLAKLMIQHRITDLSETVKRRRSLEKNKNFQNAQRFGDGAMVAELDTYAERQNYLKKHVRLPLYTAINILLFVLAAVSLLMIYVFRINVYADTALMETIVCERGWIFGGLGALLMIVGIVRLVLTHREKYIWYRAIMGANDTADEWDEFKQVMEQKKRIGRKAGKIASIAIAALAVTAILIQTIVPAVQYGIAKKAIESGNTVEAYNRFVKLHGYRDADEQAQKIAFEAQTEMIKQAVVGDTVYFGEYEQDANNGNGTEPIEWIVLEKDGDKALLLSKYGLEWFDRYTPYEYRTSGYISYEEYMQLTPEEKAECTKSEKTVFDVKLGEWVRREQYYFPSVVLYKNGWESSFVREWLNDDFFSGAFSEEQRNMIATTTLRNTSYEEGLKYNKHEQGDKAYADTKDNIFVLSVEEVEKYLTLEEMQMRATMSAKEDRYVGNYYDCWWIRDVEDVGITSDGALAIANTFNGSSIYENYIISNAFVRPAMWVDISGVGE